MESYEHVVRDGLANAASLKVPYNRLDLHIPLSQPHRYSPVRHLTGFTIKTHTNDKSHLRLTSHRVGGRERWGTSMWAWSPQLSISPCHAKELPPHAIEVRLRSF